MDSCVRMLLRWQGAYDGARVDAAACRLPDCMSDMLLMPDTSDWTPDALLPLLQVRQAYGIPACGDQRVCRYHEKALLLASAGPQKNAGALLARPPLVLPN